ncbi:hypothetical protein AB0G67_40250 [Streptomyces sp. NPDC021056]|uniref:hypothetical protein n=1 Tax=Streptomyces sp. NPDC021056 TaxID=3155012 RepID=UPI0033C3B464
MTGYLYAAIACRVLAPLTAAGSVWLALTDHPWLSLLTGWLAFLALFLGGRLHLAHRRTIAEHAHTDKETTTR